MQEGAGNYGNGGRCCPGEPCAAHCPAHCATPRGFLGSGLVSAAEGLRFQVSTAPRVPSFPKSCLPGRVGGTLQGCPPRPSPSAVGGGGTGRPERIFFCVFDFGHYTVDLVFPLWLWVGSRWVAGTAFSLKVPSDCLYGSLMVWTCSAFTSSFRPSCGVERLNS